MRRLIASLIGSLVTVGVILGLDNGSPGKEPARPNIGQGGLWVTPLSELGPEAVAFFEAQRRCLELRGLVARSPLVRVVAVGSAVATAGVTVELLALEIREAGARAMLRFAPTQPDDPRDDVRPGHPEVEVSDDARTAYEVGVEIRGRIGRGGEAEVFVVPRPPPGVSGIILSVTRFVVLPSPPPPVPQPPFSGPIEGLWEFAVPVAG